MPQGCTSAPPPGIVSRNAQSSVDFRACSAWQSTSVVPAEMQCVDDTAANGPPVQALLCLNVHHMQLCKQHDPIISTAFWSVPQYAVLLRQASPTLPRRNWLYVFYTRLAMSWRWSHVNSLASMLGELDEGRGMGG